MSIATRRGDTGETDLLFGTRLSKCHPRVHALGEVDELNAALGLIRVFSRTPETVEICATVQQHLIPFMGQIATPPGQETRYAATHPRVLTQTEIAWLDAWVSRLESDPACQPHGWSLPGAAGSIAAAHADLARTIARRAERSLVALAATADAIPNPHLQPYLNRLSDVLWLLARHEEASPTP